MRTTRGRTFLLTDRERGIVAALASGRTNREIAARLGVQERTIKNALTEIFRKTGVRNRLELALFAMREGLTEHSGT